MNNSELAKALLALDGGAAAPSADVAARVLRRDRRIAGALSIAAALLWLLCAGGVILFYAGFLLFILPKVNQLLAHPEQSPNASNDWRTLYGALVSIGHPIIVVSLIALVLASLTTVAMIYYSRRATLRYVNAALADISAQLRDLRAAAATGRPPT